MDSGLLERHCSNIFTLPKKRITLAVGILSIAVISLLYGKGWWFFIARYTLLGFLFVALVVVTGPFIRLAFNGRRTLFLALVMLLFVELLDFVSFHLGLPYLILVTPAVIASFLTIVLYFSSETTERKVCLLSIGILLIIFPFNYAFYVFAAPYSSRFTVPVLSGLYALLAVLGSGIGFLYIKYLDRDIGFNLKDFFRAFLLFWLTGDPRHIDNRLEAIKTPHTGWVRCLTVGTAHVIAQAFHAGPFRNVGGGTLVARILSRENTLYLHSATGHDKNPAGAAEVEHLVGQIDCGGRAVAPRKPFVVENDRFTVTVFPFDAVRVMVVGGKEAIDDLTSDVQTFADTLGDILVVDAHNAHRREYDLTAEDIDGIKALIAEAAQFHTEPTPLSSAFFRERVSSANICGYLALLLLDYGDATFAIFMIDANNIDRRFRHDVEAYLRERGTVPVVVSTDNHAKTGLPPQLRYFPAGADASDRTAVFSFLDRVDFTGAKKPGIVSYRKKKVSVQVMGETFFDNLQRAMSRYAWRGIYLFFAVLFLQLLAAIALGVALV